MAGGLNSCRERRGREGENQGGEREAGGRGRKEVEEEERVREGERILKDLIRTGNTLY